MKSSTVLKTFAAATMTAGAAAFLSLAGVDPAAAQRNPTLTNVVPESEAVTLQAKISAINSSTRAVTLVAANGSSATVTAGPAVRLEMLKVGDSVNAKHYRSVGFVVSAPQGGNGTPVATDRMTQLTARPAKTPGGVGVRLTMVSGTIVGINVAAHTLDLVNPSGGGVYTVDVTDPERRAKLNSLKVGDTVTAVVSETLAVSIDPAPKSFF